MQSKERKNPRSFFYNNFHKQRVLLYSSHKKDEREENDMMLLVGIWAFTAIMCFSLWSFVEIEEKKKNKKKEALSVPDVALFIIWSFFPIAQVALVVLGLHESIKIVIAKRKKKKEEIDGFLDKMNTLYLCNDCGLIQRRYQLQEKNGMNCCGEYHDLTMSKVQNQETYVHALETGLTPEMNRKTAAAIMKNEQEAKKEQQEKVKKKRAAKKQMQHLLEKAKFIQQQSDIYLKKEQEKLNKMNEEKLASLQQKLHA